MAEQPPILREGVRHIVWDWNGTLLDDNHANLAAANHVCEMFGAPFRGPGIPDVVHSSTELAHRIAVSLPSGAA